jgi:hypothetical protein
MVIMEDGIEESENASLLKLGGGLIKRKLDFEKDHVIIPATSCLPVCQSP